MKNNKYSFLNHLPIFNKLLEFSENPQAVELADFSYQIKNEDGIQSIKKFPERFIFGMVFGHESQKPLSLEEVYSRGRPFLPKNEMQKLDVLVSVNKQMAYKMQDGYWIPQMGYFLDDLSKIHSYNIIKKYSPGEVIFREQRDGDIESF